MKAVRFHEHGELDRLVYEDAPDPEASEGQLVVRVRSCALNHVDLRILQGGPGYRSKLPHIPGCDFSGDVVSVGRGVTHTRVGDRVVIDPGIKDFTCDYCLAGEQSECVQFGIIGVATDGGYAELATIPATNIIQIPDGISYDEIAAIPVTFTTAWHMLITRAKLQAGETVLILAAGSGIGSAAVQIAKLTGARVIATTGPDAKLAKAKELGAGDTINHSLLDLASEARRLTGGRGVDVVFEHVGSETFTKSLESLDRNGRLVTAGATTGASAQIDIRYIYSRQLSIIGSMLGSRRELNRIVELVGRGKLHAVIDRVMPLSEARNALELLQARKQFGKILLRP